MSIVSKSELENSTMLIATANTTNKVLVLCKTEIQVTRFARGPH